MYREITTKFVSSVLSLLLFMIPTLVHASEGQVASLKEGDPAPYSGILFDEIFAARLLAEEEHKDIECNLKINYEIEKLQAQNALEIGNLQSSFNALKEQNQSFLNIKDAEIKRLQELALKNPNENSHWWLAGGVVAGIITSITIFIGSCNWSIII